MSYPKLANAFINDHKLIDKDITVFNVGVLPSDFCYLNVTRTLHLGKILPCSTLGYETWTLVFHDLDKTRMEEYLLCGKDPKGNNRNMRFFLGL